MEGQQDITWVWGCVSHSEKQRILADPLDGSHQVAFQRNLWVLSASQQHAVLMRNKEAKRTRTEPRSNERKSTIREVTEALHNQAEMRRAHTKPSASDTEPSINSINTNR